MTTPVCVQTLSSMLQISFTDNRCRSLAGASIGNINLTSIANSPVSRLRTDMSETKIVVKTAPRDKRFPTTNQTKHCWVRYLEFHACAKEKGADDPECEKFQRWYLSLCPEEWVSRQFFFSNCAVLNKLEGSCLHETLPT